jgi:glutamine synthetase
VGLRRQLDPQAEGHTSDCMLKPVAVYPDTTKQERRAGHVRSHDARRQDAASDQRPRHHSRRPGAWFGFEQEYFFYKDGRRSASRRRLSPPQGPNTTPASATRTSATSPARSSRQHLDLCLDAGINHEGINSEVAKGQWEFQIFGKGSKNAADQMWVARYLLMRLRKIRRRHRTGTASRSARTDWNGSGMHSNFSTKYMREVGGKEYFEALMAAFDKYKNEHIAVYGPDNHCA